MEYSVTNRIDPAREPEKQRNYYIFINTYSTKVKQDGRNLPIAWIDNKKAYHIVP